MGLMLCGGGLLGMLYDLCRVFAKEFRFARIQTWIVDFCYWLAAAVIVFRLLYAGNSGELRLYVFIGLLLGGWLYFSFLSRWMAQTTRAGIRIGRKLIRLLLTIGHGLLIKPVIWLYRCVLVLITFLFALLNPIVKLLGWLLRITQVQRLSSTIMRYVRHMISRFKK